MRLICTISTHDKHENPYEFSYYLTQKGIENEVDAADNENDDYHIWVVEENLVPKALKLYEEYHQNPKDPRYHQPDTKPTPPPISEKPPTPKRQPRFLSPSPYGPVTITILIAVIGLFLWSQFEKRTIMPPKIQGVAQLPLLAPLEQKLLYDSPSYLLTLQQLYSIYTEEDVEAEKPPSSEVKQLITKLRQTPIWLGIYTRLVNYFRTPYSSLAYDGPMFEKIQQGQVWRLTTPMLLHANLLHILFNVLWFILLGNQMEFRIGSFRYILFILITAIITNTAQYLMSGPFFMGLSGVICAMLGFIWARQQRAPWEGYLLDRFTLIFLSLYILGMMGLQIVAFFFQIYSSFNLPIGIANTAHITGAIAGYILGRFRFFSLRPGR